MFSLSSVELASFSFFAESFCGPEDHIILEENATYNLTSFQFGSERIYGYAYRCKYTIEAPSGHHVGVKFRHLGIIENAYDGLFLANKAYSGYQVPEDEYISDDNILEIIFTTDGAAETTGFDLMVYDYVKPGRTIRVRQKTTTTTNKKNKTKQTPTA